MSGPLNRLPLGLLSFFDNKGAGGKYPYSLGETIIPQLDMYDWITTSYASQIFADSSRANINTAGVYTWTTGTSLVVPSNEIWLVDYYNVYADLDNAGGGIIVPAISYGGVPGGTALFYVGPPASISPIAVGASVQVLRAQSFRRFLCAPGSELLLDVQQLVLGGAVDIPVRAAIKFMRLTA